MRPVDDLTSDFARSILTYDPNTGICRWKKNNKIAGSLTEDGYIRVTIKYRRYMLHRIIWLIVTGQYPVYDVDHRNTNRSNNRWKNLRDATRSQNIANSNLYSTNKSGLKGVRWRENEQAYSAQITANYICEHLGYSTCPAAAHLMYVIAADKLFKEFARIA
jgi:hypothetical protein